MTPVCLLFSKGNICIGCQFSDLGFFLRTCCKATPKNEPSDIDLKNKLRKFGKPSWNLLSGLLKQNSIPSKQKTQIASNCNCKKHKMNINLNSTGQTMKVSRNHPRKIEAWHQHWPMKQDPPGSYPEWWSRQVRKSRTDVRIICYVDIEQARTVMMWYYVLLCYNMLW